MRAFFYPLNLSLGGLAEPKVTVFIISVLSETQRVILSSFYPGGLLQLPSITIVPQQFETGAFIVRAVSTIHS